ncbi:MAG: hypothetical protein SPL71_04580 [Oribacterium sp.]|jgi:hypothetical protein|nr:hypothetical protein [Oribacterium sp.]
MPNVLQVQSPNIQNNPQIQNPSIRPETIHQPVNPNAVGQSGAAGESQQTGAGGVGANINFESNYQSFITRLTEGMSLPKELEELLFTDGTALQTSAAQLGDVELRELMDSLFQDIDMADADSLVQFMNNQQASQVKFSGEFFDGIRTMLQDQNIPQFMKDDIESFLKSYNDFASGAHLLNQMESLGDDVQNLMLPSVRQEFADLLTQVQWTANPGEVEHNTDVINNRIIPFISKYVSATHNYGAVRTAGVLFSLYAVKYENGGRSQLEALFKKLSSNPAFRMFFKREPEEVFAEAMQNAEKNQTQAAERNGNRFSEAFSRFLEKGTQGSAGSESIDRYYQVLNQMLTNESVYMPLLHLLIPFRYQQKNVMSEMWVDPDAEGNKGGDGKGKSQKMFIKFNIQGLGDFQMISLVKNGSIDMDLFVPKDLPEKPENVSRSVQDILRRNGLRVNHLGLDTNVRPFRVDEVFPEIQEKQRGINVAV